MKHTVVIVALLAASIAALVWSVFKPLLNRGKRRRNQISPWNSTIVLLICFFLSVWCMRYAVGYYRIYMDESNDSEQYELTAVEEIFNSCVHAFQTFSMDEDYTDYLEHGKDMVEAIGGGWAKGIYGAYASLQNVAAPVIGGVTVLDILASLVPKLKLFLLCLVRFRKKKIYFSDLNERSIALAKDILKTSKRFPAIVFSGVHLDDESDEKKAEMLLEAKRLGTICVRDDLAHVRKPRFGDREYYLMDEFESDDLQKLLELTEDENVKYVKNSKIYFFVQSDLYVKIEKQIRDGFKEKEKKKLLGDGKMPTLIPIDEYRNLVQNLFDDVPLYEPLIDKTANSGEERKLTLTIFGNGYIGTQILLNAYWLGQMMISESDGSMTPCELKINVVSKDDADAFWSKIDYINPEIRRTKEASSDLLKWQTVGDEKANPYCDIQYMKADLKNGDILSSETIEPLLESDYFVVALGNDSDNIAIAEKLHCLIGEKRIASKSQRETVIAYAIFDPVFARALNSQKKYFINEKNDEKAYLYMHAFGDLDSIYCCENIYMVKHTTLVKQMDNAYANAQKISARSNESRNDEDANYKYWANLARTEHIKYKLFSLGWFKSSVFHKGVSDEEHQEDVRKHSEIYQKLAVLAKSTSPDDDDKDKKDISTSSDDKKDISKAVFQKEPELEGKYDGLEQKKEYLAWLEHRRWCAFNRTMGYRSVDFDEVTAATGANKEHRLKLHACLAEAAQPKGRGYVYGNNGSKVIEVNDRLDYVGSRAGTNYKEYDYYLFEFDYEFESIMKKELSGHVSDLDKYFKRERYSHKIEFKNGDCALPVNDIIEALKADYDIVENGDFKFHDKQFVKKQAKTEGEMT